MLRLLAADAQSWPFPFGYAYRNILGNVVASILWTAPPFIAGAVWGKRRAVRSEEHRLWVARQLANVHLAATGEHAEPHPHHGTLTGPDAEPRA